MAAPERCKDCEYYGQEACINWLKKDSTTPCPKQQLELLDNLEYIDLAGLKEKRIRDA